ncbi:MAG: hypothetical protein PHP70_03110 [Gallionella sp.]|nr:hypothetical protein [Gallionella sp.]
MIAGIFWLYAILLLQETVQEQTLQHHAATQTIARLRAQLAQPEWLSRVVPAKTMAVQLEGRLWQAPTTGLAQAAFQDWLNAAMLRAGVSRQQITVTVIDEAVPNALNRSQVADGTTPANLWKIKAKLGFDYSAPILLEFLNQIESHEKQIIVGAFTVRKEPMSHVEMELYGYFQKQAAPAGKADKELVPL